MSHIEFTKEMKKTHKILIPMMLPIHFQFLENILTKEGYHVELLDNTSLSVKEEGLKYVHNDTCYPALLVIGQMIDALKSGKYDVDHVALAITQTGGGCRASNYIHLLRKALIQAGFPQVPVISVNFANLEKQSGFYFTLPMLIKLLYGFLYADLLLWLKNQCKPYELDKGNTDSLVSHWITTISKQFDSLTFLQLSKNYKAIITSFNQIKRSDEKKIKVGIVGEIYMKYAPLGNQHLEDFLMHENCEPILTATLDFGLYCLKNVQIDYRYYHRNHQGYAISKCAIWYMMHLTKKANRILSKQSNFMLPDTFDELYACHEGFIDAGAKMGEGWLLTSEIVSFLKHGITNIVCCQPFGCLPNHIVAKGMIRKIKTKFPEANIVCVDYDPSATSVNQENRLKLMLSNATLNETMHTTK